MSYFKQDDSALADACVRFADAVHNDATTGHAFLNAIGIWLRRIDVLGSVAVDGDVR